MWLNFLGHSTVALELDGMTFLTDPVLRGRVAHLRRHAPILSTQPSPPDAVLISHLHHDHLDFPSLAKLGKRVRLIAPAGARPYLERHGYGNVETLKAGGSTQVGAVEVRATPALHRGYRYPFGPRAECLGFVLRGSQSVYFAGDTDLFPEMAHLAGTQVALLPVWGWGPTLGFGHLDPQRAAEALSLIRPSIAVPIHWGTLFPIGLGPWRHRYLEAPPRDFAALARDIAPEVEVRIIEPGDEVTIAPDGVRR
jgi:L-ascorbate metabolism protein UlaG (beta-lactamase superfamily)